MGRSFRARLAALHLAAVAVAIAVAGAVAVPLVRRAVIASAQAHLVSEARLVAAALLAGAPLEEPLAQVVGRARRDPHLRITLVTGDGLIVADTHADPGRLGGQGDRPEIAAALATGVGTARRAGEDGAVLYAAVRIDPLHADAPPVRVVRVGLPLSRVPWLAGGVGLALAAGLVAGGTVGLAASQLASRSLRSRVARLAAGAGAVAGGEPWESARARLGLGAADELGAVERHLSTAARDLAAHRAALDGERRRVEAIVGSMDEGLVVTTAAHEVLLMNEVAERLLGVLPGRWRGRTLVEVTRHSELHALVERASAEGGRAAGDVRLTAPASLDLSVSVTPLRDAEGAVPRRAGGPLPGHVIVLRDTTRLRRLERMRTDFVANVSHELKTPLAAVRAALETLTDWALDDPADARRYAEICFAHAVRLERLIDDLLVLSALELGEVRLSRRPVDLAEAADETFALLRARAEARGVGLSRSVPPGFPPLLVDRNRLVQILLNLVDNGVKFTQAGGRVTVSAEREAEGWGAVVVTDTGIGVPAADLPRLGERFYRVEKGRSREAGGTGLGLAIVKHLVQLHGGRFEVTSEPGRGTTVRVVLPLITPGPHAADGPPAGPCPGTGAAGG